MYDSNTHRTAEHCPEFQNILRNAVKAIEGRLGEYDQASDPVERSRLRLLYNVVALEREKVASGVIDSYSSLNGAIRALKDWGEPPDSDLMSALRSVELFYQQNYWFTELHNRQTSH